MRLVLALLAVVVVVAGGGVARADRAADSKVLYEAGEAAYLRGNFQEAYDAFRKAYLTSKQPALLYDMASALEGLSRPHDAAEELRAYLRALPAEPRRAAIESRVRALEEAQRILDAELLKQTPPTLLAPVAPPRWTKRRVALTAFGVVLALGAGATAIGVGVAFGQPHHAPSTLGAFPATQ